ncbi:MAG: WecB/TagA/CpsF family glycosyltransferase [Hyphomicrobiales bacterium]|nr:WecB/TagA/CpsF family glycosyltransferase [Hyphomicrobiales bacterium]MDE2018128.1 WecB/TagA/CpsF family glycosyltransferase [Hyphomicrobiales bacterium]
MSEATDTGPVGSPRRPFGAFDLNLRSVEEAVAAATARLRQGRGFTLFTANLDHLAKMRSDGAFRAAYARADLVTADGWPVVWRARREGFEADRATGADMLVPLCRALAALGAAVHFVGPSADVQPRALERLAALAPGLNVAGAETPNLPARPDAKTVDALAARIAEGGARVCVLALGAPKQELIADALRDRLPDVGFLCCGAALDFVAGASRRAPKPVQRLGLEWAWRVLGDPARLARRYAACGLPFALIALGRDPAPSR